MEYKKSNGKIYLRVDPGEDIIEIVHRVCRVQKIRGAIFHGVGSCSEVTIYTYNPETGEFREHNYSGFLDMASLTGDVIETGDDEIMVRAHGFFSYLDSEKKLQTVGGSIQKAEIKFTGELVLSPIEDGLRRRMDIVPNLSVWKF